MDRPVPRALCVIPARGGSKSIPLKNVAMLAGKPLLHYALAAALRARSLARVVVSSENQSILNFAASYGEGIVLRRPEELARDETPSLPVAQHAVRTCEEMGDPRYDIVLLLQATAPLVTPEDVDGCLSLLAESGADSCVTVTPVGDLHPAKLKVMEDGYLKPYVEAETTYRRQELRSVYIRNGSCYAVRRDVLMGGSLYGERIRALVVPRERSVNIDEPFDLELAAFMLSRLSGA